MSTYRMPDEPTVDRLWTLRAQTGEPVEWRRDGASLRGPWSVGDGSGEELLSWQELLQIGPVFDVHPDVAELPTFPWAVVDGDIESADRETVVAFDGIRSDAVRDAIVRGMNEWAAAR